MKLPSKRSGSPSKQDLIPLEVRLFLRIAEKLDKREYSEIYGVKYLRSLYNLQRETLIRATSDSKQAGD
ncbi:hypothetical protein F506_17810 [Herbaspirillum hiltneri N3]|uniref:Uncharacterized protein n=1 Tax=Herbaspirillum hiltneri N3 TaxID=1262470 RepID=A0ABM5V421_9BURK|nr:hypothetical protein F506_17810 [Herbaspirillum hiltneri N3]